MAMLGGVITAGALAGREVVVRATRGVLEVRVSEPGGGDVLGCVEMHLGTAVAFESLSYGDPVPRGVIREDGRVAVLSLLFVPESCRGRGIGTEIALWGIRAVLARWRDVHVIYLHASWSRASTATFWTRLGFEMSHEGGGDGCPFMRASREVFRASEETLAGRRPVTIIIP